MTISAADPLQQSLDALAAGNGREAGKWARVALQEDPGAIEAMLVLATEALNAGNHEAATRLCDAARAAGSQGGWLPAIEGRIALDANRTDIARVKARDAAVRGAPNAHAANEVGVLLARVGLHKPSLAFFEYAARENPSRADYLYNLGTARQSNGDLEGAKQSFLSATRIDSKLSGAWLGLAQLDKSPDEAWIGQIEWNFANARTSEEKLTYAHALSRVLEALGRWDESLEWLDRGKGAYAADVNYDRAAIDRVFAAARNAASEPVSSEVSNRDRVLFVAGLPRSGTTLTQRILDSHPHIHSRGELRDWILALRSLFEREGRGTLDAGLIDASSAEPDLSEVGERYVSSVLGANTGSKIIIDKTPLNIVHAPAILRALPGAQVICLKRSPFDALFGIYRQSFAAGFSDYFFSLDFAETVHFIARFEEMVECFSAELPPERFITVNYEDVVADLEGQARRLIDFVGVEWDPACVDFHNNPRPSATASSAQVREPIYKTALARWRRYGEGAKRASDMFAEYGIAPPAE